MNTHTYGQALGVVDTDLSLVAQPTGSWLPPALRVGRALDPQLWRMRAARGLTWHRTGKAFRRNHADFVR